MNIINGLEIAYSDRGYTGYRGASFSPSWTMNLEKPFIAACGKPSDPALVGLLRAPEATALHLGHFADAREAAYVTALYKSDPVGILTELYHNGHNGLNVSFPAELYDLPEFLTKAEAQELVAQRQVELKSGRRTRRTVSVGKIIRTDNRSVAGNRGVLSDLYGRNVFLDLSDKFGREVVKNDIDTLTINEFELRYGLEA